jgi:hypothetical protein
MLLKIVQSCPLNAAQGLLSENLLLPAWPVCLQKQQRHIVVGLRSKKKNRNNADIANTTGMD